MPIITVDLYIKVLILLLDSIVKLEVLNLD